MKKRTYPNIVFCFCLYLASGVFLPLTGWSQTIMFDDFTYSSVSDGQLGAFNKWSIINGTSGPPEGGQYRSSNITFITDPENAANKLMTLSTTVDGSSKATTHSRIETSGFEYFEGTYSARVYFTDNPYTYKDGNVQTFYTIVSSSLGTDGSKYSELDFEYMAADKWGISPDNKVLYLTSWNRYIADPWQAWKRYFSYQKSFAGWHTFTVSCTDGVNVKYWIDNDYMGSMATTDNDGSSVYPRSNMQIAFANWIWNSVVGSSTTSRTSTMQVDWVLFYKNQELQPQQVTSLVSTYRSQGLQRRNLAGNTYVTTPANQAPVVTLTAPANGATFTAPATVTLSASASDSDGSITKVEFFNGSTLLGTDTSSPYSFSWTNVAAGSYAITARATDNAGAVTTSSTASISVTSTTNQPPVITLTAPASGAAYTAPATVNMSATASDSDGSIAKVEFYNGPVLLGTDTSSPYTYTWTTSVAGSYSITARATDNAGATTTSNAISITITTSTSPNLALNKPVVVSSVETSTLTGSLAVDGNSTTRWASLYADPQWIYVDLGNTYNIERVRLNWEAAYASAYSIQVSNDAATWNSIYNTTTGNGGEDNLTNLGGTGRYVRVYGTTRGSEWGYSLWDFEVYGTLSTGNNAPTVSLTAPGNGASYTAPATITLSATATDMDGTIAQVAFYNGTTLLGTVTASPYSYAWTNVSAGTYAMKAVATDNAGATAASTVSTITVTTPSTGFDLLVQAENYGNMGGVQLETTTDTGGGQNVGYIDTQDWMAYYNITIPTSGNYIVQYRVASETGGGVLSLDLNGGAVVLGSISVPSTGGWQNWTTISHTVYINAGTYNVGIYAQTGGWNLNWFRITSSSSTAAQATGADAAISVKQETIRPYPNPSMDKLNISAPYDLTNATVEVSDLSGNTLLRTAYKADGIDISTLKPGIYTLKVGNSNDIAIIRFMKK